MRFPLDLYWIGPTGDIVRVDCSVPPRRVVRCREARSVIEVPVSPASRPTAAAAATAR